MLDYKNIVIKRHALKLSYNELAEEFGANKSGVNGFIRAFKKRDKLSYSLPEVITNYTIYELVYGHAPGSNTRSAEYEQPDFEHVFCQMTLSQMFHELSTHPLGGVYFAFTALTLCSVSIYEVNDRIGKISSSS